MTKEPIRIFIGSSSNGEDARAEMVYEYSLRRNTNSELDIIWMRQTNDLNSIWSGWNTSLWSTPFSGFRWAIPEVCNFEGRAIYTDVDMINFRDIAELNAIDLEGKPIAARRGSRFGGHEFCVAVLDCEHMGIYIPPIERMKVLPEAHRRMINIFSGNSVIVKDLDARWNSLDGDIPNMWQLHFSRMSTQPWQPKWFTGKIEEHPRKDLVKIWNEMESEASASGCTLSNLNLQVEYDILGK